MLLLYDVLNIYICNKTKGKEIKKLINVGFYIALFQ